MPFTDSDTLNVSHTNMCFSNISEAYVSEAGTHQLTGPASWHSTSSSHLGLQYPISEGQYLPTMFTIKFPANMSSKELEDSSNG